MKKIRRILISLFFMLIASFAFTEDNPWDYVEELTIELEASNELIRTLRQENFEFRENNIELRKENIDLRFYNSLLEQQLDEAITELENSNEVIISLRDELIQAQDELIFFREEYESSIIRASTNESIFGLGLGVSYPTGGEIIASITPPFLQTISVYGRFGLQTSTNIIHAGAGVIINF